MTQLSENQLETMFDESLDECHPEYELCYFTFSPSDILKSCDPEGYQQEYANWLDDMLQNEILYEHKDGTIHDEPEDEEEDEEIEEEDE